MKQFLAGSYYFFHQYNDYIIHDYDYVIIDDTMEKDYQHKYKIINKIGVDYFYGKTKTPEGHIQQLLKPSAFLLDVGHLLIPEVCKELGITIDWLKQLAPIGEEYETCGGPYYSYSHIIWQAYIINNDFSLTEDQRLLAYQSYKLCRS